MMRREPDDADPADGRPRIALGQHDVARGEQRTTTPCDEHDHPGPDRREKPLEEVGHGQKLVEVDRVVRSLSAGGVSLTSWLICLNSGEPARPHHSKRAASVVVSVAPAESMRRRAMSWSSWPRAPTASAAT